MASAFARSTTPRRGASPRHERWDLNDNMLILGNIPLWTREEHLSEVVGECEGAERYYLVEDKTCKKRKMALVEFKETSFALLAVDVLCGKTIGDERVVPISVKEIRSELWHPSKTLLLASVDAGFEEKTLFRVFNSKAKITKPLCFAKHGDGPYTGMAFFREEEEYKKAAEFIRTWRRFGERSLFAIEVPTLSDFVSNAEATIVRREDQPKEGQQEEAKEVKEEPEKAEGSAAKLVPPQIAGRFAMQHSPDYSGYAVQPRGANAGGYCYPYQQAQMCYMQPGYGYYSPFSGQQQMYFQQQFFQPQQFTQQQVDMRMVRN